MEKGERITIATETIDSLAASPRGRTRSSPGPRMGGLMVGAIDEAGGEGAAIGTVIGAAAGTASSS